MITAGRKRETERVKRQWRRWHAEGARDGRTDGRTDGRIIVLHVYCASVAAAVIDRRGRGQGGVAKKNATYDDTDSWKVEQILR